MAPAYIVFVGTFIHLPQSDSKALAIRRGALWVSTANGRIRGNDWSIANDDDLRSLLKEQGWVPEGTGRCRPGTRVKIVHARGDQNGFFFPGFIGTHVHAPQYQVSGIFGNSTLLEWLDKYVFPTEVLFKNSLPNTPPPMAYAAYNQVVSRTLANGTTFASYFATVHVAATNLLAMLCIKRGRRALIGLVCMDRPKYSPEFLKNSSARESVCLTREIIDYVRSIDPEGTMVKPIITPRSALCCTEESLKGLGKLDEDIFHIQTHISENKEEVNHVRRIYGMAYAEVYEKYGLLTDRTIIAHAVHLTTTEQDLIYKRDSKISHCPPSNSALGSGICPVRKLLDKNITVGLGTDISGGYSPSILEVVRQACLRDDSCDDDDDGDHEGAKLVSVEEALYLAARGGAASVNMKDIGGFDLGMYWDAQLIHLDHIMPTGKHDKGESRVDIFGWDDWVEKVHKRVWNGTDWNVKCVWVGARLGVQSKRR
ncbi:hypothetical protein BBP40_007359 [Aspergillus hancockii]|nr:hypothetical protein BBP40_007359 [Aspergillus hancockii]